MKHEITSLQTENNISASLKKFMRKKPFSKITVTDIISDSGYNRKTFYYHFTDMNDLLNRTLCREYEVICPNATGLDVLPLIVEHIYGSDYLMNCIQDPVGLDAMSHFLHEKFMSVSSSVITEYTESVGKVPDEIARDFLAVFFSTAMTGIIMTALKYPAKSDVKTISDGIKETIYRSLAGIFK